MAKAASWWKKLDTHAQYRYIKAHPNSKYAKAYKDRMARIHNRWTKD